MNKNYCGVISKNNGEFELFTHWSNVNISKELKDIWQEDKPVHITINSNSRKMLNESGRLEYERDDNRQYKLHINQVNIESILNNKIGQLLNINIKVPRFAKVEDTYYEESIYQS